MAVLRPMILPTVGIPQAVVASRRPRNMNQKDFYTQNLRQQDQSLPVGLYQQQQNSVSQNQNRNPEQFEAEPLTGDYIQAQLDRINQRAAPPALEPGARVRSATAELVQPSNFQVYYQQLDAIRNKSQQQIGAEAARSAYKRLQQANSLVDQVGAPPNTGSSGGRKKKGSTGGNVYGNAIPSNPAANFKFAQEIGPKYGWTAQELQAWYTLGMKESGWRNTAQNPTSTAYGIGQFLNSTWAGVGIAKTSDPRLQVEAMARYIKNRYGSPSRALAFHLSHNWY